MTRARRPRARGAGRELTVEQLDWLRGGSGGQWMIDWKYFRDGAPPSPGELWIAHQGWVLDEHMAEHPGTRPLRWWQFDAPDEMRQRLGGVGTPMRERLGGGEVGYTLGVPDEWIWPSDVAAYQIMRMPLDVPALDRADPPMFESEAAYLDRLGLLTPAERKRLIAEDFEPVSILDIIDFGTQD